MPHPLQVGLQVDTLKVVSESRVTWATSVPISVFLGLSVLDLGPMYATDRETDVRQKQSLMPPLMEDRVSYQTIYFKFYQIFVNMVMVLYVDVFVHDLIFSSLYFCSCLVTSVCRCLFVFTLRAS